MVQVGRHAGAFQGSPVLQQELPGRGSPGRHLHIAYHPPALALPQGQPLVVHQEAAHGPVRSARRCCGLARATLQWIEQDPSGEEGQPLVVLLEAAPGGLCS